LLFALFVSIHQQEEKMNQKIEESTPMEESQICPHKVRLLEQITSRDLKSDEDASFFVGLLKPEEVNQLLEQIPQSKDPAMVLVVKQWEMAGRRYQN
jgi:hypothetical protein